MVFNTGVALLDAIVLAVVSKPALLQNHRTRHDTASTV